MIAQSISLVVHFSKIRRTRSQDLIILNSKYLQMFLSQCSHSMEEILFRLTAEIFIQLLWMRMAIYILGVEELPRITRVSVVMVTQMPLNTLRKLSTSHLRGL